MLDQSCAQPGSFVPPFYLDTPEPRQLDGGAITGLREFLSVQGWTMRRVPKPERLLGDLVTKTTRLFLVGSTGVGKTMFGFALAQAMAAGSGFLHWKSERPARVLYLDGEMAAELITARSIDVLRRAERQPAVGMLTIYSNDFAEIIGTAFPELGRFEPLNTAEGQQFVLNLIDGIGDVDVVVFDNVMSLLSGNQKDEEAWNDTLALLSCLSARRIGQIWIDHTGHDKSRQYGSSTKGWRFDAVGIMSAVTEKNRRPGELAFQLSFEAPHGKARRRTDSNWSDFEPCTIRLAADQWSSFKSAAKPETQKSKMSPKANALLAILRDAVAAQAAASITRDGLHDIAAGAGFVDALHGTESKPERDRKTATMRKYLNELQAAGAITINGDSICEN